jgi:hypothetical protein
MTGTAGGRQDMIDHSHDNCLDNISYLFFPTVLQEASIRGRGGRL